MPQSFTKDADAVLEYVVDWSSWLDDDTISTSTWAADDAGITLDSDSSTTTTATLWLSGGAIGAVYALTNHIVTAAGREDERTIRVYVGEK